MQNSYKSLHVHKKISWEMLHNLIRQSNLHRILNNASCTDGMPVYRQTHTKHTESLAILSSIPHDVSGSNDSASLG